MVDTWVNALLRRLESYNLKQVSRTEYRCNSPLRSDSDSGAFCINVDKLAWIDHARDEKGSLRQLARHFGIEVPNEVHQAANTKRVYKDFAEYAEVHGAPVEAFTRAKWSEVKYQGRPALKIQTIGGDRYRFLDSSTDTHKCQQGYKKCWYGLHTAVTKATEYKGAIVITNGEGSVAVGQWYDVPCCCVPGGESEIPKKLLEEFNAAWSGPVIIAFDCDDKGRGMSKKVAQQFNASTPDRAQIVDLNLTDKGDLADFCKLYTTEARVEIEARAEFPRKEPGHDLEVLQNSTRALQAVVQSQRIADGSARDQYIRQIEQSLRMLKGEPPAPEAQSFAGLATICHEEFKHDREPSAFNSGLIDLDKVTGGFEPGQMHTIYGSSGMGKSTLAITIVSQFAALGSGLIVSTECQPKSWINKMVAYQAQVNYKKVIKKEPATPDEQRRINAAYTDASKQACSVLKAIEPSAAHIRAELENGRYPYKWLLVDSIQRMGGYGSIYERTVANSHALQAMAQEFNLALLVTSQVTRDISKRDNKMPMPEDAYGGEAIRQDSDVLLSLYYHHFYVNLGQEKESAEYPKNVALVRVIKHRWDEAQTGVKLWFDGGIGFKSYTTKEDYKPTDVLLREPKVTTLFDQAEPERVFQYD
jgi:replicative DNA helicase